MANQELDNGVGPVNQLYFPENIGGPAVNPGLPSSGMGNGIGLSELQQAILKSTGAEDTTKFSYQTSTLSDKYPKVFKGLNNEELYAQNQTALEKAGNGLAKFAGITGTTIANNTVGLLYGIVKGFNDGKFSSVYDNEFTQKMDVFSKYMEDAYPNYYTAAELKDPLALRSIFTGNFFWDKIVKNLGFSAGAALSAYGFSAALEALQLSKGLVAGGRALQALEATEAGIEEGKGIAGVIQALKNPKGVASKFGQALEQFGTAEAGAKYSTANRLLSSYLGVSGEAGMESFQNARQFRENAIREYEERFGETPKGEDLKKIEEHAAQVGNWSFGLNAAVLTSTEYIQLPRIFGSTYSGEKRMLNDIVFKQGLWKSTLPQGGVGKALYKVGNVASLFFNTAEAFEEGAQYAIQQGTNNFFNKKYRNNEQTNFWNSFGGLFEVGGEGVLGEGAAQALTTTEGLENILLGGLSGALMTAGVFGIKTNDKGQTVPSLFGTGKIGERGFTGYGGERGAYTEEALRVLNNNKLNDLIDSVNRGATINEDRERVLRTGDILESKDLETDYMLNYLLPRMKYGGKTIVDEEINYTKAQAATEEGFLALKEQGVANEYDTREAFVKRLDNVQNMANQVNENYAKFKTTFASIPKTDEKGDIVLDENGIPQRKYNDEVIDKMVYTMAKIFDYNNRIPGLVNKLLDKGILTDQLLTETNTTGRPTVTSTKEALKAINDLNEPNAVKNEMKTALQDVLELTLRKNQYTQEFNDIQADPSNYEGGIEPDVQTANIKQTEVVDGKKKTVNKEIEVGKEYPLEDSLYKQDGKLILGPKLTVLSKTLGGEYEVRLPDGSRSFLTPAQFKQFKVSDIEISQDDVNYIFNNVVDTVLKKKKFEGFEKPEDQDIVSYINSLNNSELVDAIFNEYAKVAEKYFKQKADAEKIRRGNNQILSSQNAEGTVEQDTVTTAEYEQVNKKTKLVLPRATISTPQLPGYQNSIRFGANMYTFPNRKQIRGVYVTQANEAQLGLGGEIVNGKYVGGLMNHIKGTSDVDPSKTIAVVMVEEIGNVIKVVDVDGNPMDNPTFETAVFQVMPDPKFQWSEKFGGKSMFPKDTTEDEKNAIIKEYSEFVEGTLNSPDVVPFKIEASFGVPKRVVDAQGNEVKNARTGVVAAGLIQESDLATKPVIYVPTLNPIASMGSTSYSNALGKIFLIAGNGYVPLQNKLHSKEEATAIYDAILRLANLRFEYGDFSNAEAQRLFDWLKTVTYWGTPKNAAGVNSVWFDANDQLGLDLNMSNDGTKFSFTQIGIESNRTAIIDKLQKMYNNVRSAYVSEELSNWNNPYEQILSVNPETGKITSKKWKNYQTYLLSTKGRTGEETPLTVPYQEATPTTSNREGIYFVNTETKDKYAGVIQKAKVAKKPILTPVAPSPTADFVMDGSTPNTIKNPQYGDIVFIVDGNKLRDSGGKSGVSLVEDDNGKLVSQPAIEKLAKDRNFTIEKATSLLVDSIYQKLTTAPAAPTAATVTQTTPYGTQAGPTLTTSTDSITPSDEELIRDQMNRMGDDAPFRLKVKQDMTKFEVEDWPKIEEFMKKNFPMLPLYRVKNIIRGLGGIEAWGMLKNGGIYIYENAEVGTAYHEVFEAVKKLFLSPEEVAMLNKEFRDRSGSFVDRVTGETIKYSEATDYQIKEQLAEEFRDFVKDGKVPVKPAKGVPFIVKLFNDIVNFIKTFFYGPQAARNTEELFKRMTSGFYSEQFPARQALSYARAGVIDITDAFADAESETRIKDFSGQEVNDIMHQMTYELLRKVMKPGNNIFNITPNTVSSEDLKEALQMTALKPAKAAQILIDNAKKISEQEGIATAERYAPFIDKSTNLWKRITNNWEDLLEKHKEFLLSYNIEFSDNDEVSLLEDKGKDETYAGAERIDNFRKANSAIKLLLSTVPIVRNGNLEYSTINGAKLLPTSEVYMAIINRTYTATTPDEMLEGLRQLAIDDENYRTLYERIVGKPYNEGKPNYSALDKDHQLRLVNSLWTLFNKQNPTVKNLYVLDNGDVQVGDSNFTTAARQIADEFKNGVVGSIKNDDKYFEYSAIRKGYAPKIDNKGKALIASYPTADIPEQVKFLKKLGIEFDLAEVEQLSDTDQTRFSQAALGIKKSFADLEVVSTLTGRTLSINGRLLDLATIQAKIENPEFDSVFYNVNGDATQTFIGVNALSNLHSKLSKVKNINELANTPYAYLLTDSFAQSSVILGKMFDLAGNGDRIKGTENLMESSWADGTINSTTGKKKQSSKLTYQERLVQELNMNLAGYYYNLVPGDASLEHMSYMGNTITTASLERGYDDEGGVNDIFKGYFISEMTLAQEKRDVRNSKELRFFKSILDNYKAGLHDEIIAQNESPEAIYAAYVEDINNAVAKYIADKTKQFKDTLYDYEIITIDEEEPDVWTLKNLSMGKVMDDDSLTRHLEMLQINFMINNIEYHKLLYSDPYQYKDELKRIKNFLSPRQSLAFSSELNAALNTVYNKEFKEGEIGYTDFTKNYFKTATMADVKAFIDLRGYEEGWEETDGGGIMTFPAYRNFRIRSGNWNDAEEAQFIFDMKYEQIVKAGATLEQIAKLLEKNPGVTSAYTPIKPIVAGNKGNGQLFNDIVLDKFALYPLSFRAFHQLNADSNAIKLYNKMQREGIDYHVFKSGRKVGAQEEFAPYDENGNFNETPYTDKQIVNVPFSIMATQSDVPSKDDGLVTRGSQITKLVTIDLLDTGVPVDYQGGYEAWNKLSESEKKSYNNGKNLYNEIKKNQEILEGMISLGFNNLIKSMGIKQVGKNKFEVTDFSKAASTLRREILKREVNDNVADALAGFLEGKVTLEATPAYQQIRNILYSIADREVISQKVNGGMKVQLPSTFMEENRVKAEGKNGYTSDVLKFYVNEEGKRVAEVMLSRWFDTDMTDQQLLDYFNTTEEGQEIAKGIGFRIPTQKQNSIDVIKVVKLLPKEYGDSVIIPSALVKKAGSDFDIDKLSLYLKNIYQDRNGNLKVIPYYGVGEKAIEKLKQLELDENVFNTYRKSLENAYFTSLEKLISSEQNFEPLTTPNSAEDLKELSRDIVRRLGISAVDYKDPGNMLDRRFMSRLRQAFIAGKYAIGIAAVNQTNHSLNQRTNIFIDFDGMEGKLNDVDKEWMGDGKIKFKQYNTVEVNGKTYPSLSKVYNTERNDKFPKGQRISDILSQFIDGYVDISKDTWIIELGATPNVASTYMFLAKLGVPIKTIGYFMNQPIIRDYLRKIENSGYSWLFIEDYVKELKNSPKYEVSEYYDFKKFTTIPSNTKLLQTLGAKKLTNQDDRAEQQFMLDEFLKYAKMASQLFTVTQGSNFDTATFNDPYLVFKKEQQLIKAQNTIIASVDENGNIISGVNAILKNSFLGVMAERLQDVRKAYSEVLMSDSPAVRSVIEKVLLPYTDLPDGDFIKVAQKAVADLFDWAVQIDRGYNKQITELLLSDRNASREINNFVVTVRNNSKHKLYNNQAIKLLEQLPSPVKGGVNNVKIKNKTNKVYDQNGIINGFREIKAFLGDDPLYDKIVKLAVLQSGLSKSPIAFTNLLPYEDFEGVYNQTLSTLEKMPNLDDFYTLGVFQRNNWNNDDIVPYRKAKFKQNVSGDWFYSNATDMQNETLEEAMNLGRIPKLMKLSSLARDANKDYIVYSWEEGDKEQKYEMRKRGDYSYIKKALFKKVYDGSIPLTTKNAYGTDTYIYKQINAWGDGIRANEFYNVSKKSVIPNGFEEAVEVQDEDILEYFTYNEETDAAEETTPAPQVIDESTDVVQGKISIPRRATKKTKFVSKTTDGKVVEKEGYKLIIPEYPNTEIYVTNNSFDAEGNVNKINWWFVESDGAKASEYSRTIDEAINDFTQKVNSITNPEVLKRVQDITKLFVGDPQETVTLRDNRAYTKMEIDSKLLRKLGYTPEEIGNILKEIC